MSRLVWIVDDDSSIRWVLEQAFADAGWQTASFDGADSLLAQLDESNVAKPELILTDVRMPGTDGMAMLTELQQRQPELPVIVMTAHSDLDSAVSAFKGGAFEYIAKPFDLDEVLAIADRAVRSVKVQAKQSKQPAANDNAIIGEASAMQEVFRAIGRLSRSSVSVLLTGASGTGKELVARALHQHSSRTDKPFIALNMAAIPSELIESELFGHDKGAFTGATQKRQGRFQQADGGTLFLDEIGDMPLAVQTRLLRVLAEGQFYPVGSHQLASVDVRIIAATHQDLRQAVARGDFREDLYHRLNVIHVRLPDLIERRDDIPALAEHFLVKAAKELNMPVKRLTRSAIGALRRAPWPGNVRQLENTCRWLTVMAASDDIDISDLPPDIFQQGARVSTDGQQSAAEDWQDSLRQALLAQFKQGETAAFQPIQEQIDKVAMSTALEVTEGHRQQAAELLGWGRNTLARKWKKLYN